MHTCSHTLEHHRNAGITTHVQFSALQRENSAQNHTADIFRSSTSLFLRLPPPSIMRHPDSGCGLSPDCAPQVQSSASGYRPVGPQSPMASSEPIFGAGHKCTGVCKSVCCCVRPFCHSCSFPTERVPALCVCWLTGWKERQLYSTYPETFPCQVWDEILSRVLTPHSQASHTKAHTLQLWVGG